MHVSGRADDTFVILLLVSYAGKIVLVFQFFNFNILSNLIRYFGYENFKRAFGKKVSAGKKGSGWFLESKCDKSLVNSFGTYKLSSVESPLLLHNIRAEILF
jgi:hypothetical protein